MPYNLKKLTSIHPQLVQSLAESCKRQSLAVVANNIGRQENACCNKAIDSRSQCNSSICWRFSSKMQYHTVVDKYYTCYGCGQF